MSLSTNKFDKIVHQKLDEAEMSPPADMWERIESSLADEKKRFPWMPVFISAGVLLLGALLFYNYNNQSNNTASKDANFTSNNVKRANNISTASKENISIPSIAVTPKYASNDDYISKSKDENTKGTSENSLGYSSDKPNSDINNDAKKDKSSSVAVFKKNKKINQSQRNKSNEHYQDDEQTSPVNHNILTPTLPEKEDNKSIEPKDNTTESPNVVIPVNTVVIEDIHQQLEQILDVKIPQLQTPTSVAGIDEVSASTLKKLENLKEFAGYNVKRGFHIGPYMAITYNWMSRQSENPENKDMLKSTFQLNKMYGISTGYDFSDRWGVLAEFAYAEQGIHYKDNTSDKEYDLKMNYFKIPVMMKYKIMFLNDYNAKPIILNLLFGGHYSHLQKCNMLIDGNANTFDQKYNHQEWGLMTGVDFDIYINKHLYFTSGIRSGFGANTQGFPRLHGNDGNSPISFQTGIYTKLNFRLPLKIK